MSGWQSRAACHPGHVWMADVEDRLYWGRSAQTPAYRVEEARAVCAGCPVLAQCREWALSSGERFGICLLYTSDAADE